MKNEYELIVKELGEGRVRLNEPMSLWTTFRIGGAADLFYEAKSDGEIVKAVLLCRRLKVPYFLFGGGSNLLVSDAGMEGMAIKISSCKLQVSGCKMEIDAGVPLAEVVKQAADASLAGLEFAVGIPGTFGGAVVGNAGAWQKAVGDRIARVRVLSADGDVVWVEQKDCGFDYRESRFKRSGEIVLGAKLQFEEGKESEIRGTMAAYLENRKHQPKEPSAGSIFVNPKPTAAGSLIDQCGLKGQKCGEAEISTIHGNIIVNLGQASCADVLKLITLAKDRVRQKFDINLTEEVKIIGKN